MEHNLKSTLSRHFKDQDECVDRDLNENISNYGDNLIKFFELRIAVDKDAAGKKLESELIRRLGPERCWRVEWPDGCKEADDMVAFALML